MSGVNFGDNGELLEKSLAGDEAATAALVERNMGLVRSIALRFCDRGVELDDLMQIGTVGMIKAIRSFDVSRGCVFSTYAVPLIIGEIRRHLRDDGPIKVSRIYKRQGSELLRAGQEIAAQQGRCATIGELAQRCGMSVEDAVVALEATSPVCSLSEPVYESAEDDGMTLETTLADSDCGIERQIDRIALAQSLSQLPPLRRRIIVMRYFHGMTQQAVADALGLSQVKISREERRSIEELRRFMTA